MRSNGPSLQAPSVTLLILAGFSAFTMQAISAVAANSLPALLAATLFNVSIVVLFHRISVFGPSCYILALLIFQNTAIGLFTSHSAVAIPVAATEQKTIAIAV